jgi:hypothetical protein
VHGVDPAPAAQPEEGEMNGPRLMVLLIAVLALIAAGCGGDDSNEASGDDSAVVTETSGGDDDSTTTTDDEGSTATSDDDGIELEGECAEFAGLSAKLQNALSGSSDLNADAFDELADQVPEEIRDDYEVLAANFRELAEALEDVNLSSGATPSAEDLAKLQEVSQSLDTPEVREAAENIEAWAEENC